MKEWIIPIVIAVIWILNAVLRNRENEEPVRVARGKLGERPDGRGPTSDIDRFLQEIEKMKQKSAEPVSAPPKVVRPIPKVKPVKPTSTPPRVRPVNTRVKTPSLEEVLPVVVLEEPSAATIATPLRSQPATSGSRRSASPALAGLIRQLRSPQSVVNAIVLSEILSPPKSMRR